jgi:hypothetical protein
MAQRQVVPKADKQKTVPPISAKQQPVSFSKSASSEHVIIQTEQSAANLRLAVHASRGKTAVHGLIAVCMLGLTLGYTGLTKGTNYSHYTSWAFLLSTLYVSLDLFFRPYVSPVLAPVAYAVSQSVACLTAGMYAADAGLVAQAYQDYNDSLVDFVNLTLHVFPAVAVMLLMVYSRDELSASITANRADYGILCVLCSLTFCGIYFYSFSPRHQYMIVASNTVIRSSVMLIHACFAALGAWCITSSKGVARDTLLKSK